MLSDTIHHSYGSRPIRVNKAVVLRPVFVEKVGVNKIGINQSDIPHQKYGVRKGLTESSREKGVKAKKRNRNGRKTIPTCTLLSNSSSHVKSTRMYARSTENARDT